jgi:ELWxxDGT repeat protein
MKKILHFILLLLTITISAQEIQVASDINQGNNGSNMDDFFMFKNRLYFGATIDDKNQSSSVKLWTTDATEAGTFQVGNLPAKGYYTTENHLYFTDNDNGEIWKSDGTEANTTKINQNLYDLTPVGTYENFFYYVDEITQDYTNRDKGLFKTDGTNRILIKTFTQNDRLRVNKTSKDNITKFDATRFIVYLETRDLGLEPYISDGTEAGTILLNDMNSGDKSSYPTKHININNGTIFEYNRGLWFTDGTQASTTLLKQFTVDIKQVTLLNNKIYFALNLELWETDGTESGTKKILTNLNSEGTIFSIVEKDSNLLLFAEQYISVFNVTSNTNTKLTIPKLNFVVRDYYAKVGAKIYFIGYYENEGNRLWITDGTNNGTYSLEPFWPDGQTPAYEMFAVNNKLVFTTGTQIGTYDVGELWVTDGTNAGTKLLKDINKTGNLSSNPKFQTTLNGKVYFSADDNIHGRELFVFDGTTTSLVKDINPGFQSSDPLDFYILNNIIIFKAYTIDKGLELWITDGTETGTVMLKDINPNGNGFLKDGSTTLRIGQFAKLNKELYFYADNGTNGLELWKTNGTTAGTFMIKDINVGFPGSYTSNTSLRPRFVAHNNELYFLVTSQGTNNYRMWKTNGTSAGTQLVNAVNSAVKASSIFPFSYFSFNGQFYFNGKSEATATQQMFRSDGTSVTQIDGVFSQTTFYPLNDRIYFPNKYNGKGLGEELWYIDKNDNVDIVADLAEGAQSSFPGYFYIYKDYLYFSIINKTNEREMYRVTGTAEPEKILTKYTESGTNAISVYFDYFEKEDKLYINTQHNGNSDFVYRTYITNNITPLIPVLSLKSDVVYSQNSAGGLGFMSSILDNKFYFTANLDNKGYELLVVDLSSVLNVDDFENINITDKFDFTIYPNPVNNLLNIQSNSVIKSGVIYNLLGKKISTINTNTIDVSRFKSGIYILKLEDELGNISSKKWIKK